MVVDVGYDEHRHGAPPLGLECFAERAPVLRCHDAVEWARHVKLAWLVIQHEDDFAGYVSIAIVIVPQRRCRDAEAHEDDRPLGTSRATELFRVEVAADLKRSPVAARGAKVHGVFRA